MEGEKGKKPKKYTVGFGVTGLVVGFFVTTIVLAWIFVLGILVGRGSIPNPFSFPILKKVMPMRTPPVTPEVIISGNGDSAGKNNVTQAEIDLRFYKQLESKNTVISGIEPKKEPKQQKSQGSYTVQIASFRDKERAKLFLKQMDQKDIKCYIVTSESNGVVWYRIRTGRFDDLDSARARVNDMEKLHAIKAIAVKLN